MNDFQLAWKNLWRNRRRTLITAMSVFFAVFFALVMRSFQLGAYDHMFKNVIESYTGYMQVQGAGFFDEPVIDNGFELKKEFVSGLKKDPNIRDVIPRIESYALAASGSRTKGVMVMGIDPEGEDSVSKIKRRLVKYRFTPDAVNKLQTSSLPEHNRKLAQLFEDESYSGEGRLMADLDINSSDSALILPELRKYVSFKNSYLRDNYGALIGDKLSVYLGLNIGDTLVMIGQGYHGSSAAAKFEVQGIVKLPAPDIDSRIVYLPIDAARQFYGAPGMVTSTVLSLRDNSGKAIDKTKTGISKGLDSTLRVLGWQDMNAILINQMDVDNKSGIIMIGILYLVIAFGVFGTVLMMLSERKREFGMLISIGMQREKLSKVISIEMVLMGLLGMISGIAFSIPFVYYFHYHPVRFTGEMARMYEDYGFEPVMPFLLPDKYYLWQSVIVLIILSIAILFSVRKIFRINIIKALRA